jgi:undecaprenyl-diphosphatase
MNKIRVKKNSLILMTLFILFFLCYKILVGLVKSNAYLPFEWERRIIVSISGLRTPALTSLMLLVTQSVEYFVVIPLLCTVLFLYRINQKTKIVLLLAVATLGPIIGMMLKFELNRTRLSFIEVLVNETTASFPSGHTLIALCTYGIIALILYNNKHKFLSLCCMMWCLLVAVSRLYLGAHYITDVLASFAYGGMVVVVYISLEKMLVKHMEIK